jgi:hypothetical protein
VGSGRPGRVVEPGRNPVGIDNHGTAHRAVQILVPAGEHLARFRLRRVDRALADLAAGVQVAAVVHPSVVLHDLEHVRPVMELFEVTQPAVRRVGGPYAVAVSAHLDSAEGLVDAAAVITDVADALVAEHHRNLVSVRRPHGELQPGRPVLVALVGAEPAAGVQPVLLAV